MYSKIGQSIPEEKVSSPQVGSYRLRTGSRDFPNEIPLPLKISSKDIQMDVRPGRYSFVELMLIYL
jgi:hypothetical protein